MVAIALGAMALTSLFSSCNDDTKRLVFDDEKDSLVTKMYFNNGLYPLNTYDMKITRSLATGIITIVGDSIKFPVRSSLTLTDEVQVSLGSDTAFVSKYNKANTSKYLPLPENYMAHTASVSLKAGSRASNDSVLVNLLQTDKIPVGNYLFPLVIKSASNKNVVVSDTLNCMFFRVSVTEKKN